MYEPFHHREQKFIIDGKKVEIVNFIYLGREVVEVELSVNGKLHTVKYDYFLNKKKVEVPDFVERKMIITECIGGYQLKTSSGEMYAILDNNGVYVANKIQKQPMTGKVVHGIPDKIKNIVFKLQKNGNN